jgi:hypothetical protein
MCGKRAPFPTLSSSSPSWPGLARGLLDDPMGFPGCSKISSLMGGGEGAGEERTGGSGRERTVQAKNFIFLRQEERGKGREGRSERQRGEGRTWTSVMRFSW